MIHLAAQPDLRYSLENAFTHVVAQRGPIQVFDEGRSLPDFTYIDDVFDADHRRPGRAEPGLARREPRSATSPAPPYASTILATCRPTATR
jgi:hypothetical protein